MGRITCCNVLSDLFAMGVTHCDNMLLLLGVPTDLKEDERMITNKLIMEGFRDCAAEAGTYIRGGQTVQNPWYMIGGVATSVSKDDEFIMPNQARIGDVLILTKPLGTQVSANVSTWKDDEHMFWTDKLAPSVSENEVDDLLEKVVASMGTLNLNGAKLMHEFEAHGCTDVTGFGILGHADNLAKVQKNDVGFEIHSLPCFASAHKFSELLSDRFKLFEGYCPETSGGLLIALPENKAKAFCEKFEEIENRPAWIVGKVVESTVKKAWLSDSVNIIKV